MNKSYADAAIKKLDKGQIEITGSIPATIWGAFRAQALKHLNDAVTIDGFRKGNVPENVLVAKVGEMAVLEEMAELAVPRAYLEILSDQKIDSLGRPHVSITKLAAGNPLEFKAIISVMPVAKLPDYKKLAATEAKKRSSEDVSITDKEIEDAILRARRMHASHEGHDHDTMTPEEHEKAIEVSMPELTDDFVKKIGDFSDVPDFRTKLSAMLAEDKRSAAREKTRIAIADAIVDKTEVEMPEMLIESELQRTESQFRSDIERMGVTLEDYLKHGKKTIEDARKEWRPHAEKKAKLQLILNEIAKAENIHPDAAEVEAEVNHILEHYKDADRERAAVYAETVLTNEKVFQFLEEQGVEKVDKTKK